MKSNKKCTKLLKKKKFIEFKPSNYNKLPSDDLNLFSDVPKIKNDFDFQENNFLENRRMSFKVDYKNKIDKDIYIEQRME